MDRNYFLSYGQIAFLLLLSAIGKLNARIISATESKPELLQYADIKDTDHYPYLSYTFLQDTDSSVVCDSNHHAERNDDSQYTVSEYSLQNNSPVVNDRDFYLSFMKDLKSVSALNKWRILNSVKLTDDLRIVKQIKKFYFSSVKLIDGFKFIIKIPDKLNRAI